MTLTDQQSSAHGERVTLSRTGVVYSYTTLTEPPEGFEAQAPYSLALIQLDDGPLVTAQLTDLDGPITIGDRVEMVTRKLNSGGDKGMIVYGYKFRKILERAD
jgi:hypothetical protein